MNQNNHEKWSKDPSGSFLDSLTTLKDSSRSLRDFFLGSLATFQDRLGILQLLLRILN